MAKFAVPKEQQQSALLVGIVLALIMRGIFIAVGAAAINNFSWVFYVFGAFLVYTAVKLAKEGTTEDERVRGEPADPVHQREVPATTEWHGTKILVKENGKRVITPMFVVIMALGTTDLLFALDSIPAIYGLTEEPYLVLTANIFALMGLRQLYFLIGGLLKRLVYLSYGLAFLLGFIGVKLVLHAHARERGAVHQRRRAHRLGPGDPDLALPGRHRRHPLVTTVASLAKTGRRHEARGVLTCSSRPRGSIA